MALILLVTKRLATNWTQERLNTMRHENSVFHQLTKQIPWDAFERSVAAHGSDRGVRRLRTRDQFLAVLYGQLAGAASLREIADGLRSHEARLYHAGLRCVSRSTLADANAKRPFEVYADVFAEMVRLARPGLRRKIHQAVRLLDATMVTLSQGQSPWAGFSRKLCAAKAHIVYDPHAGLPLRAVVTAGTVNDITPARAMPIEPGATYVFDLAYYSYEWWAALHTRGCRFVTRLKTHTKLAVESEQPVPADSNILSDRTGHLPGRIGGGRRNPFCDPVREIVITIDTGKTLRLVTNDLKASAQDIATLYKQRWDIELFFKWIKQNLKIRRFLGTSENAVKTQIYIALIAFLILRAAHKAQEAMIPRPQAFARIVRCNIMHRKRLDRLLHPKQTNPNENAQLALPC
jgi:IS4 transposase